MPGFSRLQTKFAANGVQFVGIALDSSDMVREFALQHPSTYPLVIGGTEGVELARLLGNPQLALPYTLIINAAGEVRFARLGGLSEQELDALLRESTAR
jgi:peroxiredoxin